MTVTPPRSDTSGHSTPEHSPPRGKNSTSASVAATATSGMGGLPSMHHSSRLPTNNDPADSLVIESLMHDIHYMTADSAMDKVAFMNTTTTNNKEYLSNRNADLQDFGGSRRHSVPNVIVGAPSNFGGSSNNHALGGRSAAGSHKMSLPDISEGGSFGMNMGGRASMDGYPGMPPSAQPIGSQPRASAPVSQNEVQSAAQWYFGGNAGGNSLANVLNPAQLASQSNMRSSMFMPSMGNNNGNGNGPSGHPPLMQQNRYNGHYAPQQQQQRMAQQPISMGGYEPQQSHHHHPQSAMGMHPSMSLAAYHPTGSLSCFLVQFTSGRTDTYYIPHDSALKANVGDYVVVEADRGEDLGRVFMDNISVPLPRRNSTSSVHGQFESVSPTFELEDFNGPGSQQQQQQGHGPVPSNFPKRIYRLALPAEIESLLSKVRDEINAIAVGQYKVQEWKLPMVIIDAEYQWDRRKLTFFFSVTLPQFYPNQPSPRIDFRTLVRDLYQIYRTRIWMYCVDKDKNRANRAHNREKFLKQLYKDTLRFGRSNSSAENPGSTSTSPAFDASPNDVEDGIEWDMREVFKSLQNNTVNVEDLTFGMAKMKMQHGAVGGGDNGFSEMPNDDNKSSQYDTIGGFSATSKAIWSDKPPSGTAGKTAPGGQMVGGGKLMPNNAVSKPNSGGEFDAMPYFVDYDVPL